MINWLWKIMVTDIDVHLRDGGVIGIIRIIIVKETSSIDELFVARV